jgi:hypothetical protein
MNTQIQFRSSDFQPFTITRNFTLGQTGISVPSGSVILFDGTIVEYGGQRISLPQFRGAIRMGWAVPSADYDPNDQSASIPRPAGVQLRHSTQGGNPLDPSNHSRPVAPVTTDEQERSVGNVREMAQAAQDRNKNRTYRTGMDNRAITAAEASRIVVEPQDGIPVRNLTTQAKQNTVLTAETAGGAISEANSAGRIQPGRGITEEEMMSQMTAVQRAEYLATKNAHKAAYVQVDDQQPRQVVGSVQAPQVRETEGFKVTGSVGGGTMTADLGGTGGAGPAQSAVVESEGMIFRTTNGPKRDVQVVPPQAPAQPMNIKGTEDARRKIAKAMCPDFPDLYNFDDPTRKKIARIQADFEDRPDIIRAIFAAESDEVKARLLEEFPSVFA